MNALPIINKCAMVHNLIVSSKLDLLAITETWLSQHNGATCLAASFPESYSSTHISRIGKRGGGVALVYKNTIKIHPHSTVSFLTLKFWTSPSQSSQWPLAL